jgi:hypothetical protein
MRPPGGLDHLLTTQRADGGWGPEGVPACYRLVPTLAATASLLRAAIEGDAVEQHRDAALRALSYLTASPCLYTPEALPDTVAVETIVPAQLAALAERVPRALGRSSQFAPAIDRALQRCGHWVRALSELKRSVAAGSTSLPPHIAHTAEVLGPTLAARVAGSDAGDAIACSPAATAAVLAGTPRPGLGARRYLATMSRRHGGAQPGLAPIAYFERVWIASQLLRCGVSLPEDVMSAEPFRAAATDAIGMAPGFLADCDVTACSLWIAWTTDGSADPASLHAFEGDAAFFTYYAGERNPSPTVNAHALDALDAHGAQDLPPALRSRNESARANATAFLLETQHPDGTWSDKWHASPYYSASCCAPALGRRPLRHAHALERVRRWHLDSQRDDGSWGIWCGTPEETAYAVQTLLLITPEPPPDITAAVRRGTRFLADRLSDRSVDPAGPMLWHGKELFAPTRIVLSAIVAALHLATERLGCDAEIGGARSRLIASPVA